MLGHKISQDLDELFPRTWLSERSWTSYQNQADGWPGMPNDLCRLQYPQQPLKWAYGNITPTMQEQYHEERNRGVWPVITPANDEPVNSLVGARIDTDKDYLSSNRRR